MTSDARHPTPTSKALGDAAEMRALALLGARGLVPVERNYQVARGPRARGGEVDLIMRDADGTLVFVEVRARGATHAMAAARSSSGGSSTPRRTSCVGTRCCRRCASTSPASKAIASSGCAPPSMRREPSLFPRQGG